MSPSNSKSSAKAAVFYRLKFQRDIYKDLRILEKSIGEGDEENSNLDLFSSDGEQFQIRHRKP